MRGGTAGLSRRRLLTGGLLLGGGVLGGLSGCTGGDRSGDPLAVASGPQPSTSRSFARLLSRRLRVDGLDSVPVLTTAGSRENIDLLLDGRASLGLVTAEALAVVGGPRDADRGPGADPGRPTGPLPLQALARVFQEALHCVVRDDGEVDEVADLAGRAVAFGPVGSDTTLTARRVLTTLGVEIDPDHEVTANLRQGARDLATGQVDALFWSGGLPPPELAVITGQTPLRALDLSAAYPELDARHPGVYRPVTLPAPLYAQAVDVGTMATSTLLVSRRELPADPVGRVVDLLLDRPESLVPLPEAGRQLLGPGTLTVTAPLQLHPAAAERYVAHYG